MGDSESRVLPTEVLGIKIPRESKVGDFDSGRQVRYPTYCVVVVQ